MPWMIEKDYVGRDYTDNHYGGETKAIGSFYCLTTDLPALPDGNVCRACHHVAFTAENTREGVSGGLNEDGVPTVSLNPEDDTPWVKVTRDTPGAKRFRIYNDDGTCDYEGWLIEDDEDECPWSGALDFGTWDAGSTAILDGNHKHVIS